jgi:hypothetical protein
MKNKFLLGTALLAALVLVFVGCKKIDEYFHEDNLVVTGCDLATIEVPWNDGESNSYTTGVCTYNAQRQPERIVFNRTCITGAPAASYLFRYDATHRLTDFIEACDSYFDRWHVYTYNSRGQIVGDSVYVWGNMDGNPPSESDRDDLARYVAYTYDSENRIASAIEYLEAPNEGGGTTVYTDTTYYNYNSEGNLIRPGATYDDKINICRTNKIWMFINRDYSRNNYIAATSYNSNGLPLEFPVSYSNFQFSNADTGTIKFTYNCHESH